MSSTAHLRLGTRGSLLARTQSGIIAEVLRLAHPGLIVEMVVMKTTGDQIIDKPLHEFGGKGLFTKELEQALLDGLVDFAVHSFKDMPTTMPLVEQAGLIVAAVPKREDPRDLLVADRAMMLDDLPAAAKVGTGSLRRGCQILARRPDLIIEPIRGNIDTRLRKQREGQFAAVVLAMAGVKRAELFDAHRMSPMDIGTLLPAPGQGALALQCRRADDRTRGVLAALNDPITAACVEAERALVALLKGDCLSPIGALAEVTGDRLVLCAAVGGRGGKPPVIVARGEAKISDPKAAANVAFATLSGLGVERLLHGAGGE